MLGRDVGLPDQARVPPKDVAIERVGVAAETGLDSGPGAWGCPFATWPGEASTYGEGLGGAAKLAKCDRADGVHNVAMAETGAWGPSHRGGTLGDEKVRGAVTVSRNLLLAGLAEVAVLLNEPRSDGGGHTLRAARRWWAFLKG